MTFPMHFLRDLWHSTLSLILLVAFAGIAGCGNDNSPDSMISPPGWVAVPSGGQHAKSATRDYIAYSESIPCTECHGADLSGGASKVSCFGNPSDCHHGPVAGWVATPPAVQAHGAAATQAPGSSGFVSCQICHGSSFTGGGSQVSCFPCHGANAPHPARPWLGPTYTHVAASAEIAPVCVQCHFPGSPVNPPNHPATPAAAGTPPGCFNSTLCHGATGPVGVIHPVPFPGATHTSADPTSFNADCSACHAVTGVSPNSAAPLCTVCHHSAASLPFTNCTSCHARPPSGTAYPDVAGSHAGHDALANVTMVCASCHNGLGSGTAGHYDRANARPGKAPLRVPPGEAAFLTVYNAKAGPAAFDNATLACANVSCHGGVTAPNWRTGSIDGNTDTGCRQCHRIGAAAGNPENNSPFSGLHAAHLSTTVGGPVLCTDCHAMANGTAGALNHYKFLNTPQMEGPAGDTVAPNGSAANYAAANQTCGTFTCHTIVHVNFSWSGGASHTVPFTGSIHTSVTSSNFAANCGSCHSETGAAAKIGPTCTACHQAASPLTSLNCTSCHGDPPSGATYPNVAGKHAVHGALPGVGVCNPCHNGLDAGSPEHYNRANAQSGKDALRVEPGDIAFLSTYNAKSGPASFNATSRICSNVSCHGGQATPDWQTATANAIDVPNACPSCHVSGTTQYNSYFSGDHARHISAFGLSATTCKRCHNVVKVNVSGHFQNLATRTFEQLPRETILPAVGYNGHSCNPDAGGLTGCHRKENW
ncbi:MAG: CxxxxCH/CxxCH domain-containing protein [Deltaproteobacteria bacterium]|nr:CxxxxCH/CxxCH domain-containing protein [Candidatus Deferrimicrobium borealis]